MKVNIKNIWIPLLILSAIGITCLFIKGFYEYHFFSENLGWYPPAAARNEYTLSSYRSLGKSLIPVIFAILFYILPTIVSFANLYFKKKAVSYIAIGSSIAGFLYILISSIAFSENYDEYGSALVSGNYYYNFEGFKFLFFVELGVFILMGIMCFLDILSHKNSEVELDGMLDRVANN